MTGFAILQKGFGVLRRASSSQTCQDESIIARIRDHASRLLPLSDKALRHQTDELRAEWPSGNGPSQSVIIHSFALLSESIRRTLGMTLYDAQLRAGLAMVRRTIAEMQTGEGKTLAAALPALAYALASRGVHVMTVNHYLAERDYQLLSPAFGLLGVTVGLLQADTLAETKRKAYSQDITYGSGHEFGFDYLRDQLLVFKQARRRLGETYRTRLRGDSDRMPLCNQRGYFFAVVDEADSVMIDEATTPLVLAGAGQPSDDDAAPHKAAMQMADKLQVNQDYLFDARRRGVKFTRRGCQRLDASISHHAATQLLRPWPEYVRTALYAKLVFQRNVDYLVEDDVVVLVDDNTGRIFANRSWRDGLRQAVETRENLPVTPEVETLARISRQRCFKLYDGLCGLTGTAVEGAREFRVVYGLQVVSIPPRTESKRTVFPARFFADRDSKWNAIADEMERLHATSQPVLAGTRTIRDSEVLVQKLVERGLSPQLLNGTQDGDEAAIIARAGQRAAITVATNMAGRGTDIRLGPGVVQLGGLHVVVCEPHESARVDRQLIGRAARQGDPGSCQQFVSADDEIIATNDAGLAQRIRMASGECETTAPDFRTSLARLQKQIEHRAFWQRRQLTLHDDWMEKLIGQMTCH